MEGPQTINERQSNCIKHRRFSSTHIYIYIANTIHVPEKLIKEVKSIILDFLWDGGSAKIPYDVLMREIGRGGLNLVDLESKVKSLKLAWIKRLTDPGTGRYKILASFFLGTHDLNYFFSRKFT